MSRFAFAVALILLPVFAVLAQPPGFGPPPGGGGFGRGPGRFGPPNREEVKLLDEYDQNKDGWLNLEERGAAQVAMKERQEREPRRGPRGWGRRGEQAPAEPGRKVSPKEVANYPSAELYDPSVLRTIFLEFESDDWESELEAFNNTDVEVPAQMTVDGQTYSNVGVHFRGMSSYMMVPRGKKRSLNVSLDFLQDDQRLYGYKTLNLLNCAGDASMLSAVVYSHIAREYIPAPKANFVHVVINGESWGIYASVQQYDKEFLRENYQITSGTRWKVPGSPGGDGGLRFLGDDLGEYKSRFEMKSSDDEEAWQSLVELCRVLNETPDEELEQRVSQVMDIDNVLRFLALDVTLVNSDGYWTRASDYYLFLDTEGKFHTIPHDINEAFALAGGGPPGGRGARRGRERRGGQREEGGRSREETDGPPSEFGPPEGFEPPPGAPPFGPPEGFVPPPGFGPPGRGGPGRGGPGHGGVDLDPLVGLDNERMPLRSRLLSIPALRDRYLGYVNEIAEKSLAWERLGPFVASQYKLIEEEARQDTRKLATTEEFESGPKKLKDFAEKRRQYLQNYEPKSGE